MASAGFSIGLLLIVTSHHARPERVEERERRSVGCPHVAPLVLLPAYPILAGFSVREQLWQLGIPGGIGRRAHGSFKAMNVSREVYFRPGFGAYMARMHRAERVPPGRICDDSEMTTEAAWHDGAIRVLVVDDHDLFRAGLASLLNAQPGIEVVAQASGGRMGVRLADELQPDVVLMDVRMPDLEGPDATREILYRHPDTRIVALTVVSDEADVAAVVE